MQRVIFTLLHSDGRFMLSRNFRLQAVGTLEWIFSNYDLAEVSRGLDELMVLDVSPGGRRPEAFAEIVREIARRCFIPLTVGGGVTSFAIAQHFLRSGADKLLLNSAFASDPALCRTLADHYGRQCIVAGIDYRVTGSSRRVFTANGMHDLERDLGDWIDHVQAHGAGELLLQSIDKDGTGMGPDLDVLHSLEHLPSVPCILMGGVGRSEHLVAALRDPAVDAIATANLFNFIGSSFLDARSAISAAGIEVAHWDAGAYAALHERFLEHA